MRKFIFSLFSIFILLALPLQARAAAPTIVGPDDREEITGKAVGPEKAVVVIEIQQKGNSYLCSGAMVAPNIVLTAAHCLIDDKEGNYAKKVSVYAVGISNAESHDMLQINDSHKEQTSKLNSTSNIKQNFTITQNNGRITSLSEDLMNGAVNLIKDAIQKEKKLRRIGWGVNNWSLHVYPFAEAEQLWTPDNFIKHIKDNTHEYVLSHKSTDDYGLIKLNYNLGDITGWLGLKVPSYEELNNADIVIIGRGADKSDRSLWMSPGDIGVVSSDGIAFNADTLRGNSGSPVFKRGDMGNIIALVNWGGADDIHLDEGYPNSGLRIRQEMIDAVETVANGGTLPGMKIIEDNSNQN